MYHPSDHPNYHPITHYFTSRIPTLFPPFAFNFHPFCTMKYTQVTLDFHINFHQFTQSFAPHLPTSYTNFSQFLSCILVKNNFSNPQVLFFFSPVQVAARPGKRSLVSKFILSFTNCIHTAHLTTFSPALVCEKGKSFSFYCNAGILLTLFFLFKNSQL